MGRSILYVGVAFAMAFSIFRFHVGSDAMKDDLPDHLQGKKGLYFHQGKFYENSNDFWVDVKKWPNEILDQETAERLFTSLLKDMQMNIFMYDRKIKNGEMLEILEKIFMQFISEINKRDV